MRSISTLAPTASGNTRGLVIGTRTHSASNFPQHENRNLFRERFDEVDVPRADRPGAVRFDFVDESSAVALAFQNRLDVFDITTVGSGIQEFSLDGMET